MAETRKDKRAPVSLKVRFKSATVDEFIEQYSKDVSRGGIFIKSGQPMPIGTLLKFQFQLKDESPLIRGVGRVVWTRGEDDATADQPAGMGIKFIKMDGESRAMVDRIVESHEGAPSTYDAGETGDEAPSGDGGGFFPDLPPAQLPPPEDRSAVRHAAQFLASALSSAATDEAAAREAEQKAEEARRRTAQIEAQRMAEAERIKQAQAAGSALPSIMIDPSLSDPAPKIAVQSADAMRAPTSERPTAPKAPKPLPALIADEEDTSVTDRKIMPVQSIAAGAQTVVISAVPEPKKSNMLPVIVITAAVIVAAFFALRGDKQAEVTEAPANAAPVEPAPAPTPPVEQAPEPVPEPEPQAAAATPEPTKAPEPAPEPAKPEEAPPAVEMVSVSVSTEPTGADVFVDGAQKGTSPITLELAKGVEVTVRAKAKGRAAKETKIKPEAKAPLKLTLPSLPYVLHVETTPAGAALNAGTKNGTSPADLTFANAPKGPVPVFARLPGHDQAQAMVPVSDFVEGEDAMRASLTLTLQKTPPKVKPAPAPAPKPAPKLTTVTSPSAPANEPAVAPSAPTPAPVAAPAPAPAKEEAPAPTPSEPAPAPLPKPKGKAKPAEKPAEPAAPAEAIPDNPFG